MKLAKKRSRRNPGARTSLKRSENLTSMETESILIRPEDASTLLEQVLASRRIGIEIEAEHNPRRAPRKYAHSLPEGEWNAFGHIKRDGSLTDGRELISPPMMGFYIPLWILQSCMSLQSNGFETTAHCGLHVHVSADGLAIYNLPILLIAWAHLEDFMSALSGDRLYESQYTQPIQGSQFLSSRFFLSCLEHGVKTHRDRKDYRAVAEMGARYHSLNVHALQEHKTLECRLSQGSLDPQYVFGWSALVQAVVGFLISEARPTREFFDFIELAERHPERAVRSIVPDEINEWIDSRKEGRAEILLPVPYWNTAEGAEDVGYEELWSRHDITAPPLETSEERKRAQQLLHDYINIIEAPVEKEYSKEDRQAAHKELCRSTVLKDIMSGALIDWGNDHDGYPVDPIRMSSFAIDVAEPLSKVLDRASNKDDINSALKATWILFDDHGMTEYFENVHFPSSYDEYTEFRHKVSRLEGHPISQPAIGVTIFDYEDWQIVILCGKYARFILLAAYLMMEASAPWDEYTRLNASAYFAGEMGDPVTGTLPLAYRSHSEFRDHAFYYLFFDDREREDRYLRGAWADLPQHEDDVIYMEWPDDIDYDGRRR